MSKNYKRKDNNTSSKATSEGTEAISGGTPSTSTQQPGQAVRVINLRQLAQVITEPNARIGNNIPKEVIGTDIAGLGMLLPIGGKAGFPSQPTNALQINPNQLLGEPATDNTLLNGRDTELGLTSEFKTFMFEVIYAPHTMSTYKIVPDSSGNINYSQVTSTDIEISSDETVNSTQLLHYDRQYIDKMVENDSALINALATFALSNSTFIDLLVSAQKSDNSYMKYSNLVTAGSATQPNGIYQIKFSGQSLILQSYRLALLNAMAFIHQYKNVMAMIPALILKFPKKADLLAALKNNMMRAAFMTTIRNVEDKIYKSYVDYNEWMSTLRYWGIPSSHSKGNDTPLIASFINIPKFTNYKFTTTANAQAQTPISSLETVVDHSALMPDPNYLRNVLTWITSNDGSSGSLSPSTFVNNQVKVWERWAPLFSQTFASVDSAFTSLTTYPTNGSTIQINWKQGWQYDLDKYTDIDIESYLHVDDALETAGYANPTYMSTTAASGAALRDVYSVTIQYDTLKFRNSLFSDEGSFDRLLSPAAVVQATITNDDPYRLSKISLGQTFINLFGSDSFIANLRIASGTDGVAVQLVVADSISQPGNADAIASDLLRVFTSVQLVSSDLKTVLGTISRPENLIKGTAFFSKIFNFKDGIYGIEASCVRPTTVLVR